MATATFDKTSYRPGDSAVVTVDYSDVPDGAVTFSAVLTPAGGTPINLTAAGTVEAGLSGVTVKVGAATRTPAVASDPANNRVTYTFTV